MCVIARSNKKVEKTTALNKQAVNPVVGTGPWCQFAGSKWLINGLDIYPFT